MTLPSPIADLVDEWIVHNVTSQVVTVLGLASIPLIGGFLTVFVSQLLKLGILWVLSNTIIGGVRIWVVQNVDWNVKNVDSATAQLKHLLDNPKSYTAQQMAEVEKNFDEKAVKLIHIVNARMPV